MYFYTNYLTFSDAAKMADVARNIVLGKGWGALFNFFNVHLAATNPSLFPATNIPPAMPYMFVIFFKIFGISDWTVILTSTFFFLASVYFMYLLGKRLFGKLAGILAAVSFAVNINFLDYAKSGASETLFVFEIVLIPYLILLRKKWSDAIALLVLVVMYFTRPQAFIFMAVYILFWFLLHYEWRKVLKYFAILILAALFFDYAVLQRINDTTASYSVVKRGLSAMNEFSQNIAVSDALRGVAVKQIGVLVILKRTVINLFNFYRSLPQIMSPYFFALFILGLFIKNKSKEVANIKIITVIATVAIFLLAALTIPFYRYVHPIVPLIYIIAAGTLVNVIYTLKPIKIFKIKGKSLTALVAGMVVIVLTVGINLGILAHDYRYYAARNNFNKPPAYVLLSEKLEQNTNPGNFVVTNLDTWGSWYGHRKTMWFPLRPEQLEPLDSTDLQVDAIYLTTYRMDDENYLVGDEWRKLLDNPEDPGIDFISKNFKFVASFRISSRDDFENTPEEAVLFVRK